MTTTEQVRQHCVDTIEKYPSLESEVNILYSLYRMESADDCASEEHEAELCYGCIEELIEDLNNE